MIYKIYSIKFVYLLSHTARAAWLEAERQILYIKRSFHDAPRDDQPVAYQVTSTTLTRLRTPVRYNVKTHIEVAFTLF